MDTPATSDTTSASTYGSNPQSVELGLLLVEQVVGHDGNADARLERGENGKRAVDRPPRGEVGLSISGRRPAHAIDILARARRDEQSPEPFLPCVVYASGALQDVDVELLERPRVRLLERIEGPKCESAVQSVHTGQCRSRRLLVIEQRVVEIKQDRVHGVSVLHMPIIETASLGCMVN